MTDAIVSRQATGISPRLPIQSQDAQIERAKLYASATGFVPAAFANKPGACLLAMDWAAKNGLDDLTALQGLHVIDGKPSVSAALRVELATRGGFEFRVLVTNDQECSLDVYDHRSGTERKLTLDEPITVLITQIPPYRFNPTKNGKESNWVLYPADMLFAGACRIADRRYVKTSAALIDARQDYDDIDDQLDIAAVQTTVATPVETDLATTNEAADGAGTPSPAPAASPDPGGQTAGAEPGSGEDATEDRIAALKAMAKQQHVKQATLLGATQETVGTHYPTLRALADDEEATKTMLDWLESK